MSPGKKSLKSVDLPDVRTPAKAVPVEEQTTLRVEKDLLLQLKMISVFENTTIMAITQRVLQDYCRRYEAATGRALTVNRRGPLV